MESRNATLALLFIVPLAFLMQTASSAGILDDCSRMSRSYRTLCISTHRDDHTIDIELLTDTGEKSVTVHCGPAECLVSLSNKAERLPVAFASQLRS